MRNAARSCLFLVACWSAPSHAADNPDRLGVPVVVPFENAKFVPASPRPNAPEIAVLWGEPRTGPSAMFIKLKKGVIPMHIHGSPFHLVVMQGSLKHWNEGETEADAQPLGPGSYWFAPADLPHTDSCLADECLVYLVWGGKQDTRSVVPRK